MSTLIYTFTEVKNSFIVYLFRIFENLTELYLPIFWFSERFEIPRNVSDQLLIVTNVIPVFIPYLWLVMALTGSIMLVFSAYLCVNMKNKTFTVLDPL